MGQAFPVKNAKVVIKRDGDIIAFLFTNDVGKTEKMIKQWQKIISAEENGIVDKFTWNSLSNFYLI